MNVQSVRAFNQWLESRPTKTIKDISRELDTAVYMLAREIWTTAFREGYNKALADRRKGCPSQ